MQADPFDAATKMFAKTMSVVVERVDVALTPEKGSLPGLRFESGDPLFYHGAPLVGTERTVGPR